MFNFLFKKNKNCKNTCNINFENDTNDNVNLNNDVNLDITSCMFYDMNTNKLYRDYIDDFINYKLIENRNLQFNIITNKDIKNKNILNVKTYFNKDLNAYYYEYNNDFFLENDSGHLEIIVKKNKIVLGNIAFKYKLNNPKFNSDSVKILQDKCTLYLFLKRNNTKCRFHIYKIIFIINNL